MYRNSAVSCDGAAPVPMSAASRRYPALLLVLFTALWLALAIDPVYRQDWLLENLLVLIAVPTLVLTHRRLRFSNFAYTCLFVFLVAIAVAWSRGLDIECGCFGSAIKTGMGTELAMDLVLIAIGLWLMRRRNSFP